MIDITGKTFNNFLVLKRNDFNSKDNKALWVCKCKCGSIKIIAGSHLRRGAIKSCGCWKTDHLLNRSSDEIRMFRIWHGVLQRCNNPSNPDYPNYGGRGIKVLWGSFEDFCADMKNTYMPDLTIERNNVNGNYEKNNCRWATRKEQLRNKRTSVFIDTPWGLITKIEASERAGLHKSTLDKRIKNGWPPDKLFMKAHPSNKVKYLLNKGGV